MTLNEIGVVLLSNQRQHRTLHVQKDLCSATRWGFPGFMCATILEAVRSQNKQKLFMVQVETPEHNSTNFPVLTS